MQIHWNPYSFDIVNALHQSRVEEAVRRDRALRLLNEGPEVEEQEARRQFMRMYRIRHWFFRLAPRWAARLVL